MPLEKWLTFTPTTVKKARDNNNKIRINLDLRFYSGKLKYMNNGNEICILCAWSDRCLGLDNELLTAGRYSLLSMNGQHSEQ